MFVRAVRKKSIKDGPARYEYLHLVQSIRTPSGPRQELLLNLGALPIKKSERRLFASEVEREITGQTIIVKPRLNKRLKQCIEKTLRRLLEKQGKEIIDPKIEDEKKRDIQSIDTCSIKTSSHTSLGSEYVCYEMYKRLAIDEFLAKKGVNTRNRALIAGLIIGRLLEPGSERHTKNHLEINSSLYELMGQEEEAPLTAYYIANDILLKHKEDLERHLSIKETQLFDLKESIILYDLTNTYIEGTGEKNPKAKYGRSKEKRSDCLLMTLGLVLTGEGFVKKSQIFSGNQAETKTLQKMVQGLGIQKSQVIVMDAGIASQENLDWLSENGHTYLVCSRSQHDSSDIIDYQSVKKYPDGTSVQMALKQKDGELFAYCKSDRKAHTEKSMKTRSNQLFTDALRDMKKGLYMPRRTKKHEKIIERIGRLKEKYSTVAKLYKLSVIKSKENPLNAGDILWEEKKDTSSKQIGIYVLRSNNLMYLKDELWETYRMLNQVEDSFRYMKSHLGFRPIYHQLETRTESHLLISVLAYRLWNMMAYQLREKRDARNWASIKQALRSHIRYTISYDTIQNNKAIPVFIRQSSEPTEQQKSIYKALAISPMPLPEKKMSQFLKM